ncbi:hypothetical protein N8203_03200 [Crocinitomicaceae bacterium]|nr:hypothetical protein [Crocinitomicaceae bacterium]
MKTTLLFLSVFLSVSLFGQNYDKLLQSELEKGCFKTSFQNLSNEGIALINVAKKINTLNYTQVNANINRAERNISDLLTACFDYNIKVMAYDKSIDLLDSENILKELSEKISTKARYFFLIREGQGELYDAQNDFELTGYYKCLQTSGIGYKKSKIIEGLMVSMIAKKMKEAIQD